MLPLTAHTVYIHNATTLQSCSGVSCHLCFDSGSHAERTGYANVLGVPHSKAVLPCRLKYPPTMHVP